VTGASPLTLGTAGHIDHGKTALVTALTGVDTDRLPQERARGISIELGYAPLELPSGRRLSVVDVPGHERFVRTMVAGSTGIDLFLLAVACDDGVMPQTVEHVAILGLLGLERGVVALTKRDLVDDDTALLARLQVEELLPGVAVVEVSSRTGQGLDELRAELDRCAATAAPHTGEGAVRMPIDRVFTLRGIGTVATGTLWSGGIAAGDHLTIEPGAKPVRVRSVQVHDQPIERATAGQRVAVALVGVERAQVRRGDTLAEAGSLRASFRLECEVHVLEHAPRELRHGERVTVHHGTSETHARVVVRGAGAIAAGAGGRVQLRLERALPALEGDHVVIRLTSPQTTIAGGRVLNPAPTRSGHAVVVPESSPPPVPKPRPAPSPEGAEELLARLAAEPFSPPTLATSEREAAAHLAGHGRAVLVGRDLAFTASAYAEARDAAIAIARERGSVTVAQLRDRLGCSRRYAQALLEAFDAEGITRRLGDERVLRRRGRELTP
jgi:selenocysteine-specific elongation factor